MLGDLFYQLGTTLGALDARLRGKGGAGLHEDGREVAVYDPDSGDAYDVEREEAVGNAMVGAAAAWLIARLLRPKPVSWTRVVLAGVAATVLADVVGRRFEEEADPARRPYADDPDELFARLGAGVAVAAGYAALLYPRIPGPPLFRGLVFGGLEVAAAPRGGLVRMALDTPGLRFPLQALAAPVDEDAGALSHLAFGLGLGLLYRYGPARTDGDED